MSSVVALATPTKGVGQHNSNVVRDNPVSNPSLQVTADHRILLAPNRILAPLPHEVLVHIKATGICGSDVHFWKTGSIGSLRVEGNCVLGHEAAGLVIAVGADSKHLFSPGDRVAIEPGVSCGACFLCSEGRYNLCEHVAFSGVYPYEGTLQRFKCHPARWLHKLPENLTYSQGALLEPLSVVMHGIASCKLSIGRPALITGAGTIGLIALAAARASGAHPLVITDVEPKRLAFAKSFVPSCKPYLIEENSNSLDNASAIRSLFGTNDDHNTVTQVNEHLAPGVVLECTGVESSINTAAYACRRGGTVMIIGVGKEMLNKLPFMHISLAEVHYSCCKTIHSS